MKSVESILIERAELISRAAVQRERLASQLRILEGPVAVVERAVEGAHWLRAHPHVVLLGVALAFALAPSRMIRIARRSFILWRSWGWVFSLLREKLLPR